MFTHIKISLIFVCANEWKRKKTRDRAVTQYATIQKFTIALSTKQTATDRFSDKLERKHHTSEIQYWPMIKEMYHMRRWSAVRKFYMNLFVKHRQTKIDILLDKSNRKTSKKQNSVYFSSFVWMHIIFLNRIPEETHTQNSIGHDMNCFVSSFLCMHLLGTQSLCAAHALLPPIIRNCV